MTTVNQDKDFGNEFLEQIVEWIGKNLDPEDVFSEEKLEDWAYDFGFVKDIAEYDN